MELKKESPEARATRLKIEAEMAERQGLVTKVSEIDRNIAHLERHYAFLMDLPPDKVKFRKSIPDLLEELLRKYGKLHVREATELLHRDYGVQTAQDTVSAALIRYSNKKRRFERKGPNVYGILEEKENE